MSSIKILYIITKSNWGGAQRYVFDLATELLNYQLPATSYQPIVALGGSGVLKEKLDAAGIRTVPIPYLERDVKILQDIRVFFFLLKLLRQEKPHIVHLNSSKIGALGALACRCHNLLNAKHLTLKAIFTLHGLPHLEPRPRWQQLIIKLLTWFTIVCSHKTILISNHDYKRVRRWWLVKKKITIVHNGIPPINFLSKEEARAKITSKLLEVGFPTLEKTIRSRISNSFFLGTIAELHKNKGLEHLIKALASLPLPVTSYKLQVTIIGSGEEQQKLEALIKQHKLENTVFLAGHIDNAASLLKAFDIFVLPSLKEGLPYVLLEAGQAGLPIIATRVGGIPEIVEHEKTGLLVDAEDTTGLAQALERIISDKNLAERLGDNVKEKIEKEFSPEEMFKKTSHLYSST